ncbi:MAG: hypothetical protein WD407_11615 [Rhodospirillales bacterium]
MTLYVMYDALHSMPPLRGIPFKLSMTGMRLLAAMLSVTGIVISWKKRKVRFRRRSAR